MFAGGKVHLEERLSQEAVSSPTLEVTKHCLDTCLPGSLPADGDNFKETGSIKV